jgi:hypothetical protein
MEISMKSFIRFACLIASLAIILSAFGLSQNSSPAPADSCKYTKPLTVTKENGDSGVSCEHNCKGSLRIAWPTLEQTPVVGGKKHGIAIEGTVGQELVLEFADARPTGGDEANALCSSDGAVNWGDSSDDEAFPNVPWDGCPGHPNSRIDSQESFALDKIMKHTYKKPGNYCISATAHANFKAREGKACSYDCTQQGFVHVNIKPASSGPAGVSN